MQIPPNASIVRYNTEVAPEVVGKKLKRVIELLLERPEFANVIAATEFRSLLVTNKQLDVADGHVFHVQYRAEGEDEPGPRAVTYQVRLVTPTPLAVGQLVSQLASAEATPISAPKLEIIQAMNALFGFYPHSHPDISTLPKANKHFALDRKHFHALGGGLEALRGYYQSVRAATGGLLVNANVAHNVFLQPGPLDRLIPQLGSADKGRLDKKLAKIRVSVTHIVRKSKKGTIIPRIKTIQGLASPKDGAKHAHPPKVKFLGANAKDVEFFLDDKPATPGGPVLPKNQYISVFDYFKKGMRLLLCDVIYANEFSVSKGWPEGLSCCQCGQ